MEAAMWTANKENMGEGNSYIQRTNLICNLVLHIDIMSEEADSRSVLSNDTSTSQQNFIEESNY